MRKIRRLAKKVVTLATSVLVVFSAFCHVSICAEAYSTTTTNYTRTYDFSNDTISDNDANTYLPNDYTYNSEYLEPENDFLSLSNGYFWYLGEDAPVFTTSADYYGYRVVMRRNSGSAYDNAYESWWLLGTPTELKNGGNVANYLGLNESAYAFWIASNYAQVQIKLAPLFRFEEVSALADSDFGEYDINVEYTFQIIGYKTSSEYNNALTNIQSELNTQTNELQYQTQEMQIQTQEMQNQTEEMQNQTQEMQNQTEELQNIQNGFDNSKGNEVNENLSASLNDYSSAEEELFQTAQDGLGAFEFKSISAYPALTEAMQYVGIYIATLFSSVGGVNGGYGIFLSVLLSVVLASMVVGLYKFYQSSGKRGKKGD